MEGLGATILHPTDKHGVELIAKQVLHGPTAVGERDFS